MGYGLIALLCFIVGYVCSILMLWVIAGNQNVVYMSMNVVRLEYVEYMFDYMLSGKYVDVVSFVENLICVYRVVINVMWAVVGAGIGNERTFVLDCGVCKYVVYWC